MPPIEKDERRELFKAAVREVVEEVLAEKEGAKKGEPPAPKSKNKTEKSLWDQFCEGLGIE